jgi:TrmH family RNA methyltransferase
VPLPSTSELDQLIVVLVRPRNPLNIGAAARAMSNFAAQRLRLVNPYGVAFREARSAVGASQLLKSAEEHKTIGEAVADCSLVIGTTAARRRALQHPLRRLDDESATLIRRQLQSARVALLFGSEKIGLTNEDFSHCHWLLHIPTQQEHISMNLGQAVAVCLYELSRSAPQSPAPSSPPAAPAAINQEISQTLLEALDRSGYIQPGNHAACQQKVRRLVLRLKLSEEDAAVLLGMVRQIVWRLRQRPD